MMAHSPVAWEHVQFKDVAVKVSNVEVYYRAVSFYLEQHPDLLVDLLKVCGAQLPTRMSLRRQQSAAQTPAGTEWSCHDPRRLSAVARALLAGWHRSLSLADGPGSTLKPPSKQ